MRCNVISFARLERKYSNQIILATPIHQTTLFPTRLIFYPTAQTQVSCSKQAHGCTYISISSRVLVVEQVTQVFDGSHKCDDKLLHFSKRRAILCVCNSYLDLQEFPHDFESTLHGIHTCFALISMSYVYRDVHPLS